MSNNSNKQNAKILFLSFTLGGLVAITLHIAAQLIGDKNPFKVGDAVTQNEAPADEVRLTSLGTPQVLHLDPSKGEQKVLLNDPSIQKNWGLMGTHGQSDIKADAAWDITQGDRRVVVAVIDTGVDATHPDLAENLWRNPGESGIDEKGHDKATNGIDDDKNGYVDDVSGWNFVGNNKDLADNHGHGTHIAGIIGAVGGNGVGISGVCPKVSLMVLKYFDPKSKGNDNLKNTIRAIRYAVDMGANVINYSGGGTDPNDDEFEAVKYAESKGVLFVAAAGNEHSNSDVSHYYPADYNLSNIVSVTAIDSFAKVLRSSNYGTKTVHIAAPGEGIYSTLPGGNYGLMTGTSQATAFVSGVAALILSHNKDFSSLQVKDQIVRTADELPGLRDKTISGGKLNSYAALAIQPAIPASGLTTHMARNSVGLVGSGVTNTSAPAGEEHQTVEAADDSGVALTTLMKHIARPVAAVPDASEKHL